MTDANMPKEYLQEALEAVTKLDQTKELLSTLRNERNELEKNLSELKNRIEKEKTDIVRDRRKEITAAFDKQTRSIESELKTLTAKRAKAREQGVKERINEETKELRGGIAGLEDSFRKMKDLPFICRNRLYYTLFCPSCLKDWVIDIILVLLLIFLALVIPGMLIKKKVLHYIVSGLVLFLLTAGYVFINNRTKGRYYDRIMTAAGILREIRSKKKEISRITSAIRKDKDDTGYDLKAYDDELSRCQLAKQNAEQQREQSLSRFDGVTKAVLCDEIDALYKEKLQGLSTELENAVVRLRETEDEETLKENSINEEYMQFIGRNCLNQESLRRMIGMIESGEAVSVADAANRLKNE